MNVNVNSGTGNPVPARRPLASDRVWAPEHRPLSGNAHGRPALSVGSVPGSAQSTQQTGQAWWGRGVSPTSWSIPSSDRTKQESDPSLSGSRPWLPLPSTHCPSPELPDPAGAWVRPRGLGMKLPGGYVTKDIQSSRQRSWWRRQVLQPQRVENCLQSFLCDHFTTWSECG